MTPGDCVSQIKEISTVVCLHYSNANVPFSDALVKDCFCNQNMTFIHTILHEICQGLAQCPSYVYHLGILSKDGDSEM